MKNKKKTKNKQFANQVYEAKKGYVYKYYEDYYNSFAKCIIIVNGELSATYLHLLVTGNFISLCSFEQIKDQFIPFTY